MSNFILMSSSQLIADLELYGFEHIETLNEYQTEIFYFKDKFNIILKLSIGLSICTAQLYIVNPSKYWINQKEILLESTITDLQSLNDLIIPLYENIDPLMIKVEKLKEVETYRLLNNTNNSYYDSMLYKDINDNIYNISSQPSPYRNRNVIWIPVSFNQSNWVLTNNNTVIVNTNDVISLTYGDYIIALPK